MLTVGQLLEQLEDADPDAVVVAVSQDLSVNYVVDSIVFSAITQEGRESATEVVRLIPKTD